MRKIFSTIALALVVVGCAQPEAKFERGNAAAVVPMTIKAGTTAHYLTDYYPQWVGADGVTTADERLSLNALTEDWSEFEVTATDEALVSTIDVLHGEETLSIVVLGNHT